jgi:hypothetical protein
VIERILRGVYGYRTEATIPAISGGPGLPISCYLKIDRKYLQGPRILLRHARCEDGRLQAHGEFSFADGTFLTPHGAPLLPWPPP